MKPTRNSNELMRLEADCSETYNFNNCHMILFEFSKVAYRGRNMRLEGKGCRRLLTGILENQKTGSMRM